MLKATKTFIGIATIAALLTSCSSAQDSADPIRGNQEPATQGEASSPQTPSTSASTQEAGAMPGYMPVDLSARNPSATNDNPRYTISGDWVVGWSKQESDTAEGGSLSLAGYNWRTGQTWAQAVDLPSTVDDQTVANRRNAFYFFSVGASVAVAYNTEIPSSGIQAPARGTRILAIDPATGLSRGEGCMSPVTDVEWATGSTSTMLIGRADSATSSDDWHGIDAETCKVTWDYNPSTIRGEAMVADGRVVVFNPLGDVVVLNAETRREIWTGEDLYPESTFNGLLGACYEQCAEGLTWINLEDGKVLATYGEQGIKSGVVDGATGTTYAVVDNTFYAWDIRSTKPRLTVPNVDENFKVLEACAGRVWYSKGEDPRSITAGGSDFELLNGNTGETVPGMGSDGYEFVQCLDDQLALYTAGSKPLPAL